MKIYYIYTALVTKGGADRVIAEKANWLAEHGHEIAIITDTQMGREPVFPLSPKVRLIWRLIFPKSMVMAFWFVYGCIIN